LITCVSYASGDTWTKDQYGMKLPHRRLRQSVGVALGALLVSGIPAISAPDPAAAATTPATFTDAYGPQALTFYTPISGQTAAIGTSRTVHIELGAGSGVPYVQLAFSADGGSTWTNIGSRQAGGGVIDVDWTAPATDEPVILQATGYTAAALGSQIGSPVTENITLSRTSGTRFTFTSPKSASSQIGVFTRKDGHSYAAVSGTTSGDMAPTVVDAAHTPPAPPTALPAPAGVFRPGTTGSFTDPVDLSAYNSLGVPTQAAVRGSDGTSSNATTTSLYQQVVTAVKATATPVDGSDQVAIGATVTDQYGLPVVGAPVRLGGHVAGVSTSPNQLAITNALGQVSFPGVYGTGWYDVYADLNVNATHGSKEPGFQVVVGTVSYAAPGKAFYHSDKPIKKAGGVYADALKGTRAAAARGYTWIDQDGQLAYKTNARLRAGVGRVSQASDLVWVNAHGAPFNPKWLRKKKKKNRFEDHPWSSLKKHAGLRDVDKTFRQNAAYHLSVEWEVKDVHPFSKATALDAAFANLATAARTYYGAAWADRVQVKVLSNLHGGQKYALKVLKHAHDFGFTTLYLARGQATHAQIPASKQKYVTYVRGAQAGYYPAIPVPGQSLVVP
jgi:hypothetical protein